MAERPDAAVTPREAATAILVRESATGASVLLLRRHAHLSFMGGAWVYPGGKVDPEDHAAAVIARCRPLRGVPPAPWRDIRDKDLEPEAKHAFLIAVSREIFEETGVLVLRTNEGLPCPPELAQQWMGERAAMTHDATRFRVLMETADLWLEPSDFLHWADWITPSAAPQRFDTRFFVVRMPEGQTADCDNGESCELLWLPLDGISDEAPPDESIVSAPPTRTTLIDLAMEYRQAETLDSLFTSQGARACVPIMPKMIREPGQLVAVMPWDAQYHALPGEGIAADIEIPLHVLRMPSRVIALHEIRTPKISDP